MNVAVVASRQVFEDAILAARAVGAPAPVTGLSTITDSLLGKLDDVWDSIESALRNGFEHGKTVAQAALDAAIAKADKLLTEAGARAREVQDFLLRRMEAFIQRLVAGAIARVPTSIVVGATVLGLATVKYTQKLIVSGSIKANLTEIFALATTGEIEIVADYGSSRAV